MQSISGNYVDTITSISGCDSVVSTHLEINPITNSFDTLEICFGDSAFLGGSFQTSTGTYFNIYANSNGCDSIHQTFLSVRPQIISYETIEICSLDSVFLEGAYQNTSGFYHDTLSSSNGCDSLIVTELQVNSVLYGRDTLVLCYGDSALLQGQYRSTPGSYMDVITSNAGCDSIHVTELIIDSIIYTNTSRNMCYLDSAFLGGSYQTTAGIYLDTLTSIKGCDSIVETQLFVDSILYGIDSMTICYEDSALLSGSYQSTTGIYVDTITSNAGCDSVLTTYLTVSPSLGSLDTMINCNL